MIEMTQTQPGEVLELSHSTMRDLDPFLVNGWGLTLDKAGLLADMSHKRSTIEQMARLTWGCIEISHDGAASLCLWVWHDNVPVSDIGTLCDAIGASLGNVQVSGVSREMRSEDDTSYTENGLMIEFRLLDKS